MSVRETILGAVMTTLAGAAGAGADIYRSRVWAVRAGADIAILVRPVADEPNQFVVPYVDRVLTIEVRVLARGEIPDNAADATVVSVFSKLMANRTLGGAALDITEGPTAWEFDDADQAVCEVSLTYRIAYRTLDNDLTQ